MNGIGHNTAAGKQLRSFVERVEYMNEEIAKATALRKDVLVEAKSLGFCTKTISKIVALRKLTEDERREADALLDLYKAALGMLDGTPLGKWARERVETPEQPTTTDTGEAIDPETGEILSDPPAAAAEPEPAESAEDAKAAGREAARNGKTVIENPYDAGDVKRAAWDEGWCEEQGSDGMGIPTAWRRTKPKPDDDNGGDA